MKLVGKVPVEPLDDERLTNIERKLVVHVSEMREHHVRAPRRLLALAGIGAALAVAVLVGWKLRRDPVLTPPAPQQLAMKGGALDLGDAQIVGKDFEVTRTAARTDIVMKPGKLELHVDHKPGRLFVVKAGDVEIEDVGTVFSVEYDGKHVDVRVTEGEVKVKHAGKEFAIKAGNAWDIELGPITIAQLTAEQTTTNATANLATQPATTTSNPGQVVAVGPTNAGSNSGSAQGSGARPRKIGGPNGKESLEKWPDEPLVPTDEKDPRKAANEYIRQATLADGESKAALMQSVAVMHLRAKNYEQARRAVEAVLHERQGMGPWDEWAAYKSALWLDVRAKCLLSRTRAPTFDDACRFAAEKYIVKFPTGQRSGAVQQVLSEI